MRIFLSLMRIFLSLIVALGGGLIGAVGGALLGGVIALITGAFVVGAGGMGAGPTRLGMNLILGGMALGFCLPFLFLFLIWILAGMEKYKEKTGASGFDPNRSEGESETRVHKEKKRHG